ncbi:MAG: hypothetical protein ACI3ZT_00895 [Candidatus Cryptobacteroides sp.]
MEKIIKQMEKVEGDVRRNIRPSISEIVLLAEAYRRWGKDFSFNINEALDQAVNKSLLSLSDRILDDIITRLDYAIAEAEADEYDLDCKSYAAREINGDTAQNRIDGYVSRLKYLFEAGIAIGFVNKMSRAKIESFLMQLIANPNYMMMIPNARKERGYAATYIMDGDLNSGRGINSNIVKAISIVGTTMIADAFHYGKIQTYKNKGAIGYGVKRNSNFDCPDCDAECAVIHPLTEIVVPVHPNCCCSTYPVFSEVLDEP